jgi:hypothetical protein
MNILNIFLIIILINKSKLDLSSVDFDVSYVSTIRGGEEIYYNVYKTKNN